MAEATTGAAMRYDAVAMLNIGTALAPVYKIMGKGFENLSDKLGAKVDETQYVNDRSASRTVTGYSPEWGFDGAVIKDDDVVTFLRAIADSQATGAGAETDMVVFDVWEVDAVTKLVAAKKYPVVVQMDSVRGGKGGEKLTFAGTLLGNGDPTDVTFNTTDSTIITPDVS